ncbi:hypothetical protein MNBD_NITROSPINAE02-298 [hydrothermal vent metagenome]|uniref:Uncharacterized protein n=1 Tax=hydrothermal vent metagenome TaxID=652676 RepID=A0A3B1BDJ7_9ZZZZ
MYRFLIAAVFVLASLPGSAFAYGYAEAEDPMVVLFKSALVEAKNDRWGEVAKLADKGVKSFKDHLFEAEALSPRFADAVKTKNLNLVAETFANLVYVSIRNKIHSNLRENFKNFKNAKSRLSMARKSYIDVLDGNVKKQDAKRSESILKEFDKALEALGSPGLFGVGKKEANAKLYKEAVNAIEASIEKTFKSFK